MRILIFAPNAGSSLSTGGGTAFVLRQARAFLEAGHKVALAGFHALPLEVLGQVSGIRLPSDTPIYSGRQNTSYFLFNTVPFKMSPYFALLHPNFPKWVRHSFLAFRPDMVWFHDDIPRAAIPYLKTCRVFLYVHFPLDARSPLVCPPINFGRSMTESIQESLLQKLSVVSGKGLVEELWEDIWCNSSVTLDAVKRIWGTSQGKIVPPHYVDYWPTRQPKDHLIASIGTITRSKNYEMLIRAFEKFRRHSGGDWQLRIIGFSRERSLRVYLSHLIRSLGISGSATITANATREEVVATYSRASIIAHPAILEPFGISVLEGMAHGCYPLALETDWTGVWRDILERGRWGTGFREADQLASVFYDLCGSDLSVKSELAVRRASYYNPDLLSRLVGKLK